MLEEELKSEQDQRRDELYTRLNALAADGLANKVDALAAKIDSHSDSDCLWLDRFSCVGANE